MSGNPPLDQDGGMVSEEASTALRSMRLRFGPGFSSGVHAILAHRELPESFGAEAWSEWQFKPSHAAFSLAFDMGLIAPWKLSSKWRMTDLGREVAAIVQQQISDQSGAA